MVQWSLLVLMMMTMIVVSLFVAGVEFGLVYFGGGGGGVVFLFFFFFFSIFKECVQDMTLWPTRERHREMTL